jgi:hypothetical protein
MSAEPLSIQNWLFDEPCAVALSLASDAWRPPGSVRLILARLCVLSLLLFRLLLVLVAGVSRRTELTPLKGNGAYALAPHPSPSGSFGELMSRLLHVAELHC